MMHESNLCLADVSALFSAVKKKNIYIYIYMKTTKEHKTGQFIVLKQDQC